VIAIGKVSKVIGCCDIERGAERDRRTDRQTNSKELKRNNTSEGAESYRTDSEHLRHLLRWLQADKRTCSMAILYQR
jgi:hypothetical protein